MGQIWHINNQDGHAGLGIVDVALYHKWGTELKGIQVLDANLGRKVKI